MLKGINAIEEDGETAFRLRIFGKIIKIDVAKLMTPSKNMWFLKKKITMIVVLPLLIYSF